MKYHQTVHTMANPFISSSRAKTFRGTWNHVFHRSRTTKRSWDITISKRNSKNYINDVEIEVQRANTASLELGLSERRYRKQNTIFSRVAIKKVLVGLVHNLIMVMEHQQRVIHNYY